jgi:hypothetical protein
MDALGRQIGLLPTFSDFDVSLSLHAISHLTQTYTKRSLPGQSSLHFFTAWLPAGDTEGITINLDKI